MSPYRPISAIVLAAGEGTRMRSRTPKVLHTLCGKPMLLHVVDSLSALPLERVIVVVGRGADAVRGALAPQLPDSMPVEFIEQTVPRGTGDAVTVALTAADFDDPDRDDDVIVLAGDQPLLLPETLAALARAQRDEDAAAAVLTAELDDPTGLGRVVRDRDGHVARIVEDADASPEELDINEINTSIYCFKRNLLAPALRRITSSNAQGEYYLTDAIEVLRGAGHRVVACVASVATEALGVNDQRSWPRPKRCCASASTCAGCVRASRSSIRRPPTSTPRSSSRPTCGCCRERCSRARRVWARVRSSGPIRGSSTRRWAPTW